MELKDLQKNWDKFGKTDPLWAILTHSDKKGGKWQTDDFFKTGITEVATVMQYIESLGINIFRRKALDFGCGVGRLTQALAHYFDEVYGVDIAPSMIELARKENRHDDKCRYYLNETDDLKLFPDDTLDFIYTNITLQHMQPGYSKNYLKEFIRILVPGGLLIFQLPGERASMLEQLKGVMKIILPPVLLNFLRKLRFGTEGEMEMYGIKRDEIVTFLEQYDVEIIDIVQDQSAGEKWMSFRYCVMKNKHAA